MIALFLAIVNKMGCCSFGKLKTSLVLLNLLYLLVALILISVPAFAYTMNYFTRYEYALLPITRLNMRYSHVINSRVRFSICYKYMVSSRVRLNMRYNCCMVNSRLRLEIHFSHMTCFT